jgi:murein DD-endopeptidase MepM/ murein hydrolase activator NlpD
VKLFFLISSLFLSLDIVQAKPIQLANLDYSNPHLQKLRNEVKFNLTVIHSIEPKENIPLEFYTYTSKKEDNFFKIMAKTGMDRDTLVSVNELSSPYDLETGKTLKIPNMRGVYDIQFDPNDKDIINKLKNHYKLTDSHYIYDKEENKWFIMGGKLTKEESSFFESIAFSIPLAQAIFTSKFGNRSDPFTKKSTFHGGVDLAAEEGAEVYASSDGIISFTGERGSYGNLIILNHKLGYETRYGHLQKILVKEGEKVHKGQVIGRVGHTGRATGNHLHFEVVRNSKKQPPVFKGHGNLWTSRSQPI